MGMGCWAIGGPFWNNGQPVGWGQVKDEDSNQRHPARVRVGSNLL